MEYIRFKMALRCYNKALEILQKSQSADATARTINNIATLLYNDMDGSDEALKLLETWEKELRELWGKHSSVCVYIFFSLRLISFPPCHSCQFYGY